MLDTHCSIWTDRATYHAGEEVTRAENTCHEAQLTMPTEVGDVDVLQYTSELQLPGSYSTFVLEKLLLQISLWKIMLLAICNANDSNDKRG